MILIHNTLCFYLYLLLVSKSNARDYAAQEDRDNACSKSVGTNLKVERKIEMVKDSIKNAIREHKRDIENIKHEFIEKMNKLNAKLKNVGQFEKSGEIYSIDYLINQLRKSQEFGINAIMNKTKLAIYEQEIKLKNTLKYYNKKIVCVEEQGFKSMIENSKLPHKMLTCGEVVIGQQKEALLKFTINEKFSNYRKCIWTLRMEYYNEIRLQMLADNFAENDFLIVTDINKTYYSNKDFDEMGSITLSTGTVINQSNRSIFEFFGPVVFITYVTKEYNEGSGFLLKIKYIRNLKYRIHGDLKVECLHSNSGSNTYSKIYIGQYPTDLFWTMVINPPIKSGKGVMVKLEYVDIENHHICARDALTIYNFDQNDNSLRYKRVCNSRLYNETIVSSDGAFIITFISGMSSTGHNSNDTGFRFSWETIDQFS